jgi:hypothetical protein
MTDDPKAVKIEKKVDPSGTLTVTPCMARVTGGDQVDFTACGTFTVQFKGLSPFEKGYFTQADPVQVVHPDARPGSYPYAIAILDTEGNIYLDAATPVIENDW